MNNKLKKQYVRILKNHVEEGLYVLETNVNIMDEQFQRLVVNINNCANIIVQLEADLKTKPTSQVE